MREGWIETTLGDVAEVVSGGTPSTSTPEFWDGDVTWITPTEVTANEGKVIFNSVRRLTTKGLDSSSAKLLPVGSVLLTSRATIGAVALAGTELSTNQGFASLIAGSGAIPRFLMYWCQQNKAEFESRAAGNTFKEISRKKVAEIPLHLPPLAEQRRIVDVIESVDTYITALETRAEAARTARTALLHHLLSNPGPDWTETTLGKIVKIRNGKYVPKSDYVSDGRFWIYGSNSVMGKLNVSTVDEAHVIMAAVGANAGKVRYSADPSWINNNAFGLVPIAESVDAHYSYLWLETVLDLNLVVGGTGQPYVQRPHLLATQVSLPPLEEQRRIVDVIESVDTYITALETQAEDARTTRASLLSDLLSGNHEIPGSYDHLLGAA